MKKARGLIAHDLVTVKSNPTLPLIGHQCHKLTGINVKLIGGSADAYCFQIVLGFATGRLTWAKQAPEGRALFLPYSLPLTRL